MFYVKNPKWILEFQSNFWILIPKIDENHVQSKWSNGRLFAQRKNYKKSDENTMTYRNSHICSFWTILISTCRIPSFVYSYKTYWSMKKFDKWNMKSLFLIQNTKNWIGRYTEPIKINLCVSLFFLHNFFLSLSWCLFDGIA